jgi:transcriptional regulator with XRE-family HTH domain
VRRRLRELRVARGLTLEAVAARSALDVSTLSRLESGKRRLALDHLPVLARALGVSTDALLEAPAREDPRVRPQPRRVEHLTMWPLTRHTGASGLQAYKIRIDPARTTPPDPLPTHEGHEWVYVLAGRLRLVLGEDELVVGPGEAVEFSTLVPHWMGCVEEAVEVIALFGPHGERVHLHA